jgi:SAM-dependent methyltransferase
MSQQTAPQAGDETERRENYAHVALPAFDKDLANRRATQRGSFFLQHLHSGMRLLDCGCGPGTVTLGLAEAVAPGETIGIDIERRQIDAASALAAERGVANVRFEVGSIYELPYPESSFDAAYAQSVLFHLREPLRALKELRRVLKPGGVVGIVDGDFGCELIAPPSPAIDRLLALLARGLQQHGGDPYYARNLRPLLYQAGFERAEGSASMLCFGSGDSAGRTAAEALRARFKGTIENTVIEHGWATREEVEAIYAGLENWAEQPNTFAAFGLCSGLGWAPAHI